MDFVDFSKEIVSESPLNSYGGSEKKRNVVLSDGNRYMLKFPDPTRAKNAKASYIDNVLSEYIGCKIVASMGLPVQEVVLGWYSNGSKTKLACACKDLRYKDGKQQYEMIEASKAMLGDFGTTSSKTVEIGEINDFISALPGDLPALTRDFYYKMFVADALIGNTDRHNGNWAFLADGDQYKLCPIYDCGSSFDSLLPDTEIDESTTRQAALSVCSALSDRGKRIAYKDFFAHSDDPCFKKAICDLAWRINLNTIEDIIDSIPSDMISDARRGFYKNVISIRYSEMFIPAYERLLSGKSAQSISSSFYLASEQIFARIKTSPKFCAYPIEVDGLTLSVQRISESECLLQNSATGKILLSSLANKHHSKSLFASDLAETLNDSVLSEKETDAELEEFEEER